MEKPDLIEMFLKDAAVQHEDTAASIISGMNPKDYIGVIIQFVQELGRSAAQEAFALIDQQPNERERITQLVRMAHRCAAIEAILERIADDTGLYEPTSRALEFDVAKAYEIVTTHKRGAL